MSETFGSKVKATLLKAHEAGCRKESVAQVVENVFQHDASFNTIQTEDDLLCIKVDEAPCRVSMFPHRQIDWHRFCSVPHELAASVERDAKLLKKIFFE